MALDWPAQSIVDSLPGIAYVVGLDGRIVACNSGPWRRFAEANGAYALADPRTVIGRPLTSFIEGEGPRRADECVRASLQRGEREQVALDFRCDSPDRIRRMRLHVSLIWLDGQPAGFLYQSVLLSERPRPTVTTLSLRLPGMFEDDALIVTACSYCERFRHPFDSRRWIGHEEYDALRLPPARISHGMCDTCFKRVTAEFFGSVSV